MGDRDTMTVASLLSKLFIHSAVPEEVCSLEAWHILFRSASCFVFQAYNVVECKGRQQFSQRFLNSIEKANVEENVCEENSPVTLYLSRLEMRRDPEISEASLIHMSLFQFMSCMDRRGKLLRARAKNAIVKEKPYLHLDARRREAGGMARMWFTFASSLYKSIRRPSSSRTMPRPLPNCMISCRVAHCPGLAEEKDMPNIIVLRK